ncbi:MAG: phosphate propanoyltransferase [Candidatus Alkaliphilus sp. MAG34]|nr:phosphate propanoyltransferase [Clostridiales bacterium]
MGKKMLPAALSNRHIHLTEEDIETLFGKGYDLTKLRDLSQPGQYACEEKIDLVGPKGTIKGVRVLGPPRVKTQVEISLADGFVLGIVPPVRDSGDVEGSPGVKIVGPKGELGIQEGLIAAARHIHINPDDAEAFGLVDGQRVRVRTFGFRALIFENVLIRVGDTSVLEMHVDIEEGNAAGLKNGDLVELIVD